MQNSFQITSAVRNHCHEKCTIRLLRVETGCVLAAPVQIVLTFITQLTPVKSNHEVSLNGKQIQTLLLFKRDPLLHNFNENKPAGMLHLVVGIDQTLDDIEAKKVDDEFIER